MSFGVMRLAGSLVDRFGSFLVGTFASVSLVAVLYLFFYAYIPGLPVMALFIGLMTVMGFRNVAYNTLTTKVPRPPERARFQSLQSSIQHAASATGAFLSAKMLDAVPALGPNGPLLGLAGKPIMRLEGITRGAAVAMVLSLLLPALLFWVERRVRAAGLNRPAPLRP